MSKWSWDVMLYRVGFISHDNACIRIASILTDMFGLDNDDASWEARAMLRRHS